MIGLSRAAGVDISGIKDLAVTTYESMTAARPFLGLMCPSFIFNFSFRHSTNHLTKIVYYSTLLAAMSTYLEYSLDIAIAEFFSKALQLQLVKHAILRPETLLGGKLTL